MIVVTVNTGYMLTKQGTDGQASITILGISYGSNGGEYIRSTIPECQECHTIISS
ncbi:hypothetical protein DPMN_011101 [Dreissena polymorpha]|uniref:Uncharacterized protein n=1 Tax=Dreissena polymorpha TaxID=45954 RepID=A0A9D4RZX1_DREPO|nr:hypothetical protein DPMN_011101 [Dreissena polymorpha]